MPKSKTEPEKRLVYVEYRTENDADGAQLKGFEKDDLIELTRDRVLIGASVSTEDSAQGIVCAYLGVDGHWHLDHHLTAEEIRKYRI